MLPAAWAAAALALITSASLASCPDGDLDGDGAADAITVEFAADRNGGVVRYVVTVEGARFEGRGDGLLGTCEIVDIDAGDRYREIAIPEAGPSDDPLTHFVRFDGRDVRHLGSVPGRDPTVDGSGAVMGTRRGTVLHTWFHPAEYRVDAGDTLAFVPQDLYPMNAKVTLREDLELFVARTDDAPGAVARRGQHAMVIQTDDESWCLLEVAGGARGWFRCDGALVEGRPAHEVFAGLAIAD